MDRSRYFRMRKRLGLTGRYTILAIWFLVSVLPPLTLVLASMKSTALFQTIPEIFSLRGFTTQNYQAALDQGNFLFHLRNSLVISFSSLAVVLVVTTPMAYGITLLTSRRAKSTLVFSILSTRFLPYVVIAMPMYLFFREIGLTGTLIGVIFAHLTMQMPMMVWLLLGFFSGIPYEVQEAAVIDGCRPFQVFWRVSLPMVLPGLNAAAILAFIISYNDFIFAFFLGGRNVQPLTVGITRFVGGVDVGAQYGVVAAYGAMIVVPIVIFSFIVNRYIVTGLTQGAVKG